MTRLRLTIAGPITLTLEDTDAPPSRPFADAEAEGEEISGLRPALALRPIAKATSRLAEVVPLFKKAAG